ncbi:MULTISPECIES: DUF3298 and DUF4163 domain-containing protein [unclassified Pseudodesulfovibrio]|uniref:DUF3298 and DUF4163 domain-containing protein n=1 Tax=unclassified Pseudodesulfovibrio TaxID=2661612 RepID=UPI000FEB6A53|nr:MULTISPECIES: DUF3298 and DUF4163 domain-containing protein [unclassified Pseudodesulfovibrio]MCJ2166214.1 DUF3298 and DUF4163 domain-containing protein [Pseudodesulfovibrio sp. S3-i]RWU02304.1 DUF3298/DUF4163 domain-containing protein [Pseudodesulfovibrio sp. S3]
MRNTLTLLILLSLVLLGPSVLMAGPPCAPLVLTSVTIREETTGFSVDTEYPVLCQTNANRTIRDWVSNRIFDLKKLDPGHDLTDFPHKYDMSIRYAVWSSPGQRYASVKLDVSVYSGGAHPNHWPMTWVFDLTNGRDLPLAALFPDTDPALEAVAAICRSVLPDSLGDMYVPEMLEAGTEPFFENYDRFILTTEGVSFFFPPYQVGPYAAGEQVVTIPYDNLSGHIASDIVITTGHP